MHLNAMLALCETVECRRGQLLAYFGQNLAEPCGNCDTCLSPPQAWDGTVAAQKVLSTVFRLARERGQSFGVGQVVDILLGRDTEKVRRFHHQELSVYGVGTDLAEPEWRTVVRQLLAQGLLTVEGVHGTLVLTEPSGEVLAGRREVRMRLEPARTAAAPRTRKTAPAVDLAPEDATVFEALRTWRAGEAKTQGKPAYIVFGDATLRAIATARPANLAALALVSGVGETKLDRYGEAVLAVVAEH
jgi:ATP-dependent DNA helicase RecQ